MFLPITSLSRSRYPFWLRVRSHFQSLALHAHNNSENRECPLAHRRSGGRISRRRPTLTVFPTVVQVILWAHLGPFYRQDVMSGDPSRAEREHPPRPWEENKGQWKTRRREQKRETAVSNQDMLNDTMHLQPVCVRMHVCVCVCAVN